MEKPNLKELKNMIVRAENELQDLRENDRRRAKQKRITRALERACALLNRDSYTQSEVDKMTRVVWRSLQDGIPIIWFWVIGVLLAGSIMFAAYETYSFFGMYWNKPLCRPGMPWWSWCESKPTPERPDNPINPIESNEQSNSESSTKPTPNVEDDLTNLVTVNYTETNIVNLTDLIPVSDEVGLKNKPQEFNIANDSSKIPSVIDYDINYNVNIVELNQNATKIIDKKYIRYRLTYDDYNGKKVVVNGKLSDLSRNPDGSYKFISGSQKKDATSYFSVVFWIDSTAGNDQQGASYLLAFRTTAAIDNR